MSSYCKGGIELKHMRRRLLRLRVAAGVGETACEAAITCRPGIATHYHREDRTGEIGRGIHQAENGPCRHERLFTPEERTYLICLDSLVQHSYQVISLAQIAGSFRECKFRPGRYQQVSCF